MSARGICVYVTLAVCVLLKHAAPLQAQGVVNFNNNVLINLGCGDAIMRGPDGFSPLLGSDFASPATYVAQLYYGPSANSLVAHTATPARFRPAGVNPPGTWVGGNRILAGLAPGQLAVLSVRVWDMTSGPTYEEALYRRDNGPFYYQVPTDRYSGPTNSFMNNFRARNGLSSVPANVPPPIIQVQPQSQTVRAGENAMLSVVVSNGWLGHWRFNGNVIDMSTPCRDVETLRLTNVQPSHAGSYQLIAENYTASVTSEVGVISVVEPAIVRFANDVPFQTPGERIVRWPDGSGITGTNYVVQLYYGPDSSNLQPLPDPPLRFRPHDTPTPGTWLGANRTLPGIAPGTQVWLEVRMWDSRHGATFEQAQSAGLAARFFPFTYTPPVPPIPGAASYYMENFRSYLWLSCPMFPTPVIHVQPTNHTVQAGSAVTLRVVAEYPCRAEWYFNGALLPETQPGSTTLTITNVQSADVGDYYARVINIAGPGTEGAVTSQVARVTLVGQPRLSSITHSADRFMFEVPTNPGETFVIETTTNLSPTATWIPIRTNTAPFWFTNSAATERQRFYRTVFR